MAKALVFTVGLPGSGKTRWATEQTQDPRRTFMEKQGHKRIDIDHIMRMGRKSDPVITDVVATEAVNYLIRDNRVILDGPFFTNDDVLRVLKAITEKFRYGGFDTEVHWWREDREACLWNDRGRRDESSRVTIETARFEEPDTKLYPDGTVFVRHDVVRKPDWSVWRDERMGEPYRDDKYLRSDTWRCGGTTGRSCWGGESYAVDPEPAPADFKELTELLMEICPNISFLQYRKLYAECVDTEQSGETDYYGNSSDYQCYRCDMPRLYDMLVEMNLIEPVS